MDAIVGSHVFAGGGPVPTACCTFTRLGGGDSLLITGVGDDHWGQFAREELDTYGVDHSLVVTRRRCPTAMAFAWIEHKTGVRTIILDMDKRLYLKPRDLNLETYPIPKYIHIDGRYVDACLKLVRWGKRHGAKIMLDVGSLRNPVDKLFPWLDYLICADAYALPRTNSTSVKAAARRLKKRTRVPLVVVSAGTGGAFAIDEQGDEHFEQAFIVKAVDTTGAGDVYHGSFLFGLSKGWDIARIMKFASAAAALKCTKPGARAGIPSLRKVTNFLKGKPRQYRGNID